MNDGRCDRQGRFVVGGIDEDGLKPISSVIRYDGAAVETLIEGVGCANAICFAPGGDAMYFADTPTRVIRRYAYRPGAQALPEPEQFAALADGEGYPDGACVDAEGGVWSARYAGGSVQRYTADGAPERLVRVDAPNATCCCFGGENLDRLYITTARENLNAEALAEAPASGGIFAADVGVRGAPETRFAQRLFP